MKQLTYSDKARDDLIRLRQFIATKSPVAAQRIGSELIQRIEKLRIFSEMGVVVMPRIAPTLMSGALNRFSLRDMVFGSYFVRYSVHPDAVLILRIWHQLEERERESSGDSKFGSDIYP